MFSEIQYFLISFGNKRGHVTPFWSKTYQQKSLSKAFRKAPRGDSAATVLALYSHSFSSSDHGHGGQSCSRLLSAANSGKEHIRVGVPKTMQHCLFVDLLSGGTVWGCSLIYDW